jgi:hypothetical protein
MFELSPRPISPHLFEHLFDKPLCTHLSNSQTDTLTMKESSPRVHLECDVLHKNTFEKPLFGLVIEFNP